MQPVYRDDVPLGALFSVTTRAQSVFLNDRLRPYCLSAGQFPVLMLLAKEQNIMQETLVRHYNLDKGTIARAAKKLEDGGYIHRIVDPGNRRAVRIFLTERGEAIIPVLREIDRAWEERVCEGLGPQGKKSLASLVRTVADNSRKIMREAAGDADAAE